MKQISIDFNHQIEEEVFDSIFKDYYEKDKCKKRHEEFLAGLSESERLEFKKLFRD